MYLIDNNIIDRPGLLNRPTKHWPRAPSIQGLHALDNKHLSPQMAKNPAYIDFFRARLRRSLSLIYDLLHAVRLIARTYWRHYIVKFLFHYQIS